MKRDIHMVEVSPQIGLSIRANVPNPQIGQKMGEYFGELMQFFGRNRISVRGPPFALYHDYNQERTDMECGLPLAEAHEGEGRIEPCVLPGGKVVMATHIGPYDKLMDTYAEMQKWMGEKGIRPKKIMWERYLTDPDMEKDPSKYMTEVYWPME